MALAVGLLSTAYPAGLCFLFGAGLAWGLSHVLRSRRGRRILIGGLAALLVLLTVLGISYLLFLRSYGDGPVQGAGGKNPVEATPITLESYSATIEPKKGSNLAQFELEENATISFGSKTQPLILTSTRLLPHDKERSGFLLREARFSPLGDYPSFATFTSRRSHLRYSIDTSSSGEVTLVGVAGSTDPQPTTWEGTICDSDCLSSEVKLLHFPEGSFSEADNKNNLEVEHYRDTEEITWSPDNLGRIIAFSYVSSPYYRLPFIQALLRPFESLSSLSTATFFFFGAALVAFGKLVDFIQKAITMTGWWRSYLKPRLSRARRKADGRESTSEQEARNGSEQTEPNGPTLEDADKEGKADEEQRRSESR